MKKILIILGHTGSGKSEIATNLAIQYSRENRNIYLVDLDIVNPYFCIRDLQKVLTSKYNIEIISSNQEYRNAELMVTPKNVGNVLLNEDSDVILDIGGNIDGVKVLNQYKHLLNNLDTEIFLVINPFRNETSTINSVRNLISQIEYYANIKIDYLISNANLMEGTTLDIVEEGLKFTEEISNITSIPIKYIVVPSFLNHKFSHLKINKLFIDKYIVTPW